MIIVGAAVLVVKFWSGSPEAASTGPGCGGEALKSAVLCAAAPATPSAPPATAPICGARAGRPRMLAWPSTAAVAVVVPSPLEDELPSHAASARATMRNRIVDFIFSLVEVSLGDASRAATCTHLPCDQQHLEPGRS